MPRFEHATAKIAVWNLAGFNPISEEKFKNQVKGLALLDAEIVTLVEVKPVSYIEKIVAGLAEVGIEYEFVILPQQRDLNIGVIFKKGVVAKNAGFVEGSDLGNADFRKALTLDMKVGNFDFKLIGVHLKSGRNRPEQGIRDEQCKVIGDYITKLKIESSEDVLLMGDFNMIPGQDVSNFHYLGGDDVMDFVSCWDLQDRFSHILKKGRANLLDGFAIARTYSKEYIRGSLRLFPMHWTLDMGRERYRDSVSDHLPFVASFRIDRER